MSYIQTVITLEENNISGIQSIGPPILKHKLSFAVKKENTQLLKMINEGLRILKKTGQYDKIYKKWFHHYERKTVLNEIWRYVILAVLLIIILTTLTITWNRSLKKQVALKSKELLENKKHLQTTLQSIGEGVIITDLHGYVTMMNPVAERLTEWTFEDAGGLHLDIVAPHKEQDPFDNRLQEILNSPLGYIRDKTTIKSKSNKAYTLSFTGALIKDTHQQSTGIILIFRNINKEIELEEKLHHYSKMQSIGELAGGIAHDFNNMLTGIIGATEILESHYPSGTESANYLELIERTTQRASSLTDKLLTFGRKGHISMQDIDLHQLLKEVDVLLGGTISKNIDIQLQLSASHPIIKGDKSALQNLFMNLGINACHAMPKGGELSIITKNITLNETYCSASPFPIKEGNYLKIIIKDSGTGIPQKNIKKIFEPFFTTKPAGKGTGLGLATAYGITKEHFGEITVKSKWGIGTTFTLLLPSLNSNISLIEDKPQSPKGKGKILFVDDEEIIRKTSVNLLKKLGYDVISAKNGVDALKQLDKHSNCNLVITDVVMPEMDGRELFMEIKRRNQSTDASIQVMMISGYTGDDNIEALKALGLSAFLMKPYALSDLSQKVSTILQQETP